MPDYWKIDGELVERLCKISKIEIGERDRERYMKQLAGVLDTFKMIDEISVDGEEPAFHPVKVENAWREDKPNGTDWNPTGNAKSTENGYFKGPKIV